MKVDRFSYQYEEHGLQCWTKWCSQTGELQRTGSLSGDTILPELHCRWQQFYCSLITQRYLLQAYMMSPICNNVYITQILAKFLYLHVPLHSIFLFYYCLIAYCRNAIVIILLNQRKFTMDYICSQLIMHTFLFVIQLFKRAKRNVSID